MQAREPRYVECLTEQDGSRLFGDRVIGAMLRQALDRTMAWMGAQGAKGAKGAKGDQDDSAESSAVVSVIAEDVELTGSETHGDSAETPSGKGARYGAFHGQDDSAESRQAVSSSIPRGALVALSGKLTETSVSARQNVEDVIPGRGR